LNDRQFQRLLPILLAVLLSAGNDSIAQLAIEQTGQVDRTKRFEASITDFLTLQNGQFLIGFAGAALLDNNWNRIWPSVGVASPYLIFPLATNIDGSFFGLGDTNHCVRHVSPGGLLDPSFTSPAVSPGDPALIQDIKVQGDGRILVACRVPSGRTSSFEGVNRGLFRLNADGSTDTQFQYQPQLQVPFPFGILQIVILADGKLIVTDGVKVYRLLPDGQSDSAFFSIQADGPYTKLAIQPDGKIVVVGRFTRVNGLARPGLARFAANGTLDFSFSPTVGIGPSPIAVKIQPSDGGIFVTEGKRVRRWFSNGQQDPGFAPPDVTQDIGAGALAIDASERVYYNDGPDLYRYSGHVRVTAPPADVPVSLEQSASVETGWSVLTTHPANTPIDYILGSAIPATGNAFFRTRPAQ
jgi:hypothetical protein